ncbi:MAG: hypothetical protein ACRCVG_00250 [Methanobacteriaceae archaeon]
MVEKTLRNYAILMVLEETRNIMDKILNNHHEIDEFSYNDVENTYNILVSGLFNNKEFKIVLTSTQNGTNIFFKNTGRNLTYRLIDRICENLY